MFYFSVQLIYPYVQYVLICINVFCSNRKGPENTKKRGRGTLKCLKAIAKRIRTGNQKLKVEFSRLGGAVGENYRTFTDEVVMFTRKRAPLIGVRSWKDIDQGVKDSIATDVLV